MPKINALIILTIFSLSLITKTTAQTRSGVKKVIIDADTGNEMDDLYAIVMSILSDQMEVIGLTSAHFNNPQLLTDSLWHIYPTRGINTLEISQQLNEEILHALDRSDIPHPKGANRMLGYAWGYYDGAPIPKAPAIDYIIEQAQQIPEGEKLEIVCLGAVTNVASAIELAPEIAEKITVYLLGMQYDVAQGIWDKNEFNVRNDLNAMDQLLKNEALGLYIMPASTSSIFTFKEENTLQKLAKINHPISKILARRWSEVNAGDQWIMWDLALIQAILHPQMAELEERLSPAENGGRPIMVYTAIKPLQMKEDFWKTLEQLQE